MGTTNTEMQICNNSIMNQGMSRLMKRVFIFESDQSVWRFTLITHSHEPLSLDRRNGRQWDTKASWCLEGTFTYSCIHWASGGLVCVCVFIDLCLPPCCLAQPAALIEFTENKWPLMKLITMYTVRAHTNGPVGETPAADSKRKHMVLKNQRRTLQRYSIVLSGCEGKQ